jgi:hypothetical protein
VREICRIVLQILNTSLSRGERGGFDPANITHRFVAIAA